jgi:hypothetical protein
MKFFARYLLIPLLIILISACAGHNQETGQMTVRQRIGNAYGVQYFSEVEQIQYTFNVKGGENQISRFWIWEPKLNRVTFKGTDYTEAVSYYRHDIETTSSAALKKVDAWFINDNYWLLFPFHIVWDTDATIEDSGRQKLPIGDGKAARVVVSFPASGGYTPGDVYEVFLDDHDRLTQWVYRRGGSEEPTRVTTWEKHRQLGPLLVSLDHRGSDENFRIWFTGVGIQRVGAANWIFTE